MLHYVKWKLRMGNRSPEKGIFILFPYVYMYRISLQCSGNTIYAFFLNALIH